MEKNGIMKFLISSSAILLIFLLSCSGGDEKSGQRGPTAEWYEELSKTNDDNLRLALYDKIIAIDPQDSYAYYERAHIYQNQSQYEEAVLDFARALRVDVPDHPPTEQEIYCSRGDAYTLLGKDYLAVDDYSKAIEIDPMFSPAYESRARIYEKLGELDKAERDRQTAISLSSRDSSTSESIEPHLTGK